MQDEIQSIRDTTNVEDYTRSQGLDNATKKRKRDSATIDVSPSTLAEPGFHGATSADYSLKIASMNLGRLQDPVPGLRADVDAHFLQEDGEEPLKHGDGEMKQPAGRDLYDTVSVRVFTELPLSRAKALIEIYADAVGTVHPIVDLSLISSLMNELYSSMEDEKLQPAKNIRYHDVIVIRLVLSIALMADQEKNADLIRSCYEGVEMELNRLVCSEVVGLRGIILVVLGVGWLLISLLVLPLTGGKQAVYHFFSIRHRIAWRLLGSAGRMAMELGLHRSEALERRFTVEKERLRANRLMWTVWKELTKGMRQLLTLSRYLFSIINTALRQVSQGT